MIGRLTVSKNQLSKPSSEETGIFFCTRMPRQDLFGVSSQQYLEDRPTPHFWKSTVTGAEVGAYSVLGVPQSRDPAFCGQGIWARLCPRQLISVALANIA